MPNEGLMFRLADSGWVTVYNREVDPQFWAHPQIELVYTEPGHVAPLTITTARLPTARPAASTARR